MHLRLPYTLWEKKLIDWSSFPSDHAALFIASSVGLSFISARVGIVAIAYTILFICVPRIYLGIHYPTDILGGAAIGAASAYLVTRPVVRQRLSHPALRIMRHYPGLFYASLFLLTYEFAVLFNDVRTLGSFSMHVVHAWLGRGV